MVIITARGRSIPLITRNSSVLSSIAESDPSRFTTGRILWSWPFRCPEAIFSSRARILSALPRIVLISPLWTMRRFGCARSQLGLVLVLNREWTVAMADS